MAGSRQEIQSRCPSPPAFFNRIGVTLVWSGLIALLLLISWSRGWPGAVESPYWYLSYAHGFIRRGLIGTITSPFLVGRPLATALAVAASICTVTTLLVVGFLSYRLAALIKDPAAMAAVMAFAVSPTLSMLARDLGFLDIFLIAATLAAAACHRAGRTWLASAICLLAPLIHEAFFFLAAPALAGAAYGRRGGLLARLVPLFAMAAATLAVWFGASRTVIWQSGIPIGQSDLDAFAAWQLGQQVVLSAWPAPSASVVVLSALSVAVSAAAAWRLEGAFYGVATALGGLFTASILAVAIDVDRFIAWAPVTSIVMLALCQSPRTPGTARAMAEPG
jgi:hypothetical protein